MNELNIHSWEYYTKQETLYIIPECMRFSNDFELKKNVILVVNCDSDLFLHNYMRSLYNKVNKEEFTLIIFDNSWSAKFNEDIYFNYGFNNILYLDNTLCYLEEEPKRYIINVKKSEVMENRYASVIHSKTVDFMIKYLKQQGVKNLILTDSDILFKKNPLEIIDENYYSIFEYDKKNNRLDPCFSYFNLDKVDINFFDETRMLGISSSDLRKYDTGGAFYEDLIKIPNSYKLIKYNEYIEHFGGGSYIYNAEGVVERDKIKPEEQPQHTYKLIGEWFKKHINIIYE